MEPEQARFRLFDSIALFLKNASQDNPMVLMLDNLHWADRPSLLLLQFIGRQIGECPFLIMGTYRDVELSRDHPLTETLVQMSQVPAFQRQLLKGLDEQHAQEFIKATAGVLPTPSLVAAIYSHTEGNPFFMTEVVRLL